MRFCDLGTVTVAVNGTEQSPGGRRLTAILSVLLIHANHRVPVDTLMAAVWGDAVTPGTASTLESHLWRLRRVVEPSRGTRQASTVLVNDTGGYRLLVGEDDVDSLRFEKLADLTRDLMMRQDPGRALRYADDALALWRGRPYEPFTDEEWAAAAVARLDEIHAQVQERRLEAMLGAEQIDRAIADAEALIHQFPYRERLWASSMLALAKAGRTEDALDAFQRARTVLQDDLGLDPGPELVDLQRRILAQDVTAATPQQTTRPPPAAPVHLPASLTPLVGREQAVQSVAALISDTRLVTIVGAAGCGKTRLAVEVARRTVDAFPDGVWFVSLAAADRADLVVDLLASELRLSAPAVGTALTALSAHARDRRMLFVLDNCEHVLPAVVDVVNALLSGETESTVLATSREPLDLDGEVIWSLEPLPVPHEGPDGDVPPDDSPSVDLFVQRLRASVPTLALTAPGRQTIAAICRAVDGLPLALELAAARARAYSLEEIAQQVRDDPSALSRLGSGDSQARTLRSVIESSARLMSPSEQILHRRLSVLPGPFPASAAAALGPDALGGGETTDLLALLVHRSLLSALGPARPGGPSLFSQLATVRGHAGRALVDAGELVATVRHRDSWVERLMSAAPRSGQIAEMDWFQSVEDAYPTIRATLQHTLIEAPSPIGVRVAGTLYGYWYYRGLTVEGNRWLELAVSGAHGATPIDAVVARLSLVGVLALRGRVDLARPLLQAVLAESDPPEARRIEVGEHLVFVAGCLWAREDKQFLPDLATRVSDIAALTADADLTVLGEVIEALGGGLPPGAAGAARLEALYERASDIGNLLAAWLACAERAAFALFAGEPDVGIAWTDRVARLQRQLGSASGGPFLEHRANFSVLAGRPREAVRLYAAAETQTRRAGLSWPRRPFSRQLMERARRELSPADFTSSWHSGLDLTLDDVLDGDTG